MLSKMKRVLTALLLAVGLFTTQSAQMVPSGALPTQPASCADANWANVKLLAVNESGANTSTSFTDQSTTAQTLTAAGNAQWSTAQAPTGETSSLLGDGTGDQLATGSSTSNNLTGTTTVEGFVRFAAKATSQRIAVFKHASGKYVGLMLAQGDSTALELNHFGSGTIFTSAGGLVANGTWYHWALVTSGGTTTLYWNGTSVASASSPWVNEAMAVQLLEASPSYTGNGMNGNQASVRLTQSVARYTGTFTPPSTPLPHC